jgi:1-acyl-sn-glycerol-3-phosphate acyltransferase
VSSYRPPDPPGPLKHAFVRYGLRLILGTYLRVRVENADLLPERRNFLVNFSHPNWVDPLVIVGYWPDRRWVMIFGPREPDMHVGARNRIIRWARFGVPFKPHARDLIDTTKRALAVLERYILVVAGEGRLSDREGEIVPLEDGPAYLALRSQVPIVPLAVIGTRWLRFGKRITLRFGPPIETAGRRADRDNVQALTADLTRAMERLLEGVEGEPPPGPFGRWLTDVFNERPWLEEEGAAENDHQAGARSR